MNRKAVESIDHYDGQVPAFIEEELERLYGARYACVEYFRIEQGLDGISAWRCARDGEPVAILLYQQRHDRLWVLNQGIEIDACELARFAAHMFRAYPQVGRIDFHAVATDARRLAYPNQCLISREDMVAALPAAVDEYVASLGKSTRHNLRRYRERLLRDHPGFDFRIIPRAEIRGEHLRALQRLNRERLDDKGRTSTLDEAEFQRLWQFAARYGFVTLALIGEQVVGGMLSFVIGGRITFRIIAHDPAFDDYSLGFLIYFMTICEAIRLGCTQMNFGWDFYPYKLRLGGRRRKLAMIILYRSRYAYALDAAGLITRWLAQLRQDLANGLREAALSGNRRAHCLYALAVSARRRLQRHTALP